MADTPIDDDLSAFLATFPTTLRYSKPESSHKQWVFWSQCERPQTNTNSSSDDPDPWVVHEMIRSAFCKLQIPLNIGPAVVQFWAAVKTGGKLLLTTSDQPFAVGSLRRIGLAQYRLCSLRYEYNIDVNNPRIVSGAPAATTFLDQMPELLPDLRVHQMVPLVSSALKWGLMTSFVLPVFYPSQSCCVGVVECSTDGWVRSDKMLNILDRTLKKEGLKTFDAREYLPYKIICGLEHAKDEIGGALKIICKTHDLGFAQVWIAHEDENHVAFSSLEDTKTKRAFGLKLVDHHSTYLARIYESYKNVCDMCPWKMGEGLVGKTLQTLKPHFIENISDLSNNKLMELISGYASCFVISLRSTETSDLDYAFEFFFSTSQNNVILLESLLLTLKRCLPSFKYACGRELGDELCILDAEDAIGSEIGFFKIFQESELSPVTNALPKGRRPVVEECSTGYKAKCKTTLFPSREEIEPQFGKTMKEAAENPTVSLSSLKRKCNVLGISKCHGKDYSKRKVNESYKNQSDTNENGAIQDLPAINEGETHLDENTLTIKVEFADDIIKFDVPMSSASFVAIQKEIVEGFKLKVDDYKLKYLDEDGDWILITSEKSMRGCIKNWRNSASTAIRLSVLRR